VSLGENPTAQFKVEEDKSSIIGGGEEANGRLKAELASLIERLEGALVKFKERKEKLRNPETNIES
jgi:hypothetical protein